jgi:hypothetical protein
MQQVISNNAHYLLFIDYSYIRYYEQTVLSIGLLFEIGLCWNGVV